LAWRPRTLRTSGRPAGSARRRPAAPGPTEAGRTTAGPAEAVTTAAGAAEAPMTAPATARPDGAVSGPAAGPDRARLSGRPRAIRRPPPVPGRRPPGMLRRPAMPGRPPDGGAATAAAGAAAARPHRAPASPPPPVRTSRPRRARRRLARALRVQIPAGLAPAASRTLSAGSLDLAAGMLSVNLQDMDDLCQVILGKLPPREYTKDSRPA
jgi:hypothetical protein